MSLTTFSFFAFLFVSLILFYLIRPAQKYILLAASIYFYISISPGSKIRLSVLIAIIGLWTYLMALVLSRTKGKLRGLAAFLSIAGLIALMIVFKLAFNIAVAAASLFNITSDFSWLQFGAVVGMSYYVLTAVGYLTDVYWGNTEADKNIINVFLFIFFFPQLISGPITRYDAMRPQFCLARSFDTDRLMLGMRRMAWGYFKKLVISERFAVIVSGVFGYYTEYSLVGIIGASLCYAVRLYTDFSGCMDIVLGAAYIFGIELPENFKAPFFSESTQEFWQRWHITLGTWFKDYVMYPLQKSKAMQSIGKWSKKTFGKKHGKKVPMYLSMAVLWMLIGIWHGGTAYYFIASGVLPGLLLIAGDVLSPVFKAVDQKLHINTECVSWKWFRRIRTVFLISMCWMAVCTYGIKNYIEVIRFSLTHLWNCASVDSFIGLMGFTYTDVIIMCLGVLLLIIADHYTYKGESIFKVMDRQNYLIRVLAVYAEVIIIFVYGMVGSSAFIYFQF